MTLVMADNGAVYGGFEDVLVLVGDSGVEAINALCEGRPVQEVRYTRPPEPVEITTYGDELSTVAVMRLKEAGWYADRSIDIDDVERQLGRLSYSPSSAVLRFLRGFSGLVLTYPYWRDETLTDKCDLNPVPAAEEFPRQHLQDYHPRVGTELTVIGKAFLDTRTLLMAQDGRVYMGMVEGPEMLELIGTSGIKALNHLCDPRQRN